MKKTISKRKATPVKPKTRPVVEAVAPPEPRSATPVKNCLSCLRFIACTDARKAFSFRCARFKSRKTTEAGLPDFDSLEEWMQAPTTKTSVAQVVKKTKRKGKERRADDDAPGMDGDGFDIERLVQEIVEESRSGITPDLKIDDRDLKEAKNFYEFCTDPNYLGYAPYAKQLEVGINYYNDYCPNPKCTDLRYAHNIPTDATYEEILDRVTLLEYGACPRCKTTRAEGWKKGVYHPYSELAGLAGQRSGKSALLGMMATYTTHRYMKLQNAPKLLGLLSNTTLHGVFIATTFAQAKDSLFDPINNLIGESKWFQEYHALLDHYGRKTGEELYKFKETIIQYKPRSLLIYPSVPNKRTLRGRSLFLGGIDEIGWFDNSKESAVKLNADEIHGAMKRSFLTVRSAVRNLRRQGSHNVPEPLLGNISSPSSRFDKICRLVEEAKQSKSIYAFHYCLPGDTLIPTDKGLLRIDEMAVTTAKTAAIDLTVLGSREPAPATHWHYSGKKKIWRLTTDTGHELEASATHPVLVWHEGRHVWRQVENIKIGDLLCLNPHPLVRNSALMLSLTLPATTRGDLLREISLPTCMTPGLAYAIGALVAEGTFTPDFTSIYSSNVPWLENIKHTLDATFGLEGSLVKHIRKGASSSYQGKEIITRRAVYRLYYTSKALSAAWGQLGLSSEKFAKKTASWFKVVPWSILQADAESQKAFIAAYLEADGWVGNDRHALGVASRSTSLLRQFQLLLNSHGIFANRTKGAVVTASAVDAAKLYNLVLPYLTSKKTNRYNSVPQGSRRYGVPFQHVRDFINSRKLPRKGANVCRCTADDGTVVEMHASKARGSQMVRGAQTRLMYSAYDSGVYDGLLHDLNQISTKEYKKLRKALRTRYWYTAVKKIEALGVKDTYDLTIDSNFAPAFVANGVVVHNSVYEMNPTISEEDLEDERRSNPENYKRDYLAVPPRASNAFFHSPKIIRACTDPRRKNAVVIRQKTGESASGTLITTAKAKFVWRDSSTPRLLAIDAGEKDNSFAGAVMSLDNEMPVVDALFEIIPQPEAPLNFTDVYENVLCPVVEALNVKFVTADRWNSAKILQDLEAHYEIPWKYYSLTYPDMTSLRTAMVNAEVALPKNEIKIKDALTLSAKNYPRCMLTKPVAHFMVQALTVEEVLGKTVMKGEKKTDDLFRAFALGYTMILNPEVQETLDADRAPRRGGIDMTRLGAVASYGRGGMRVNSPVAVVGSRGSGRRGGARTFTTR